MRRVGRSAGAAAREAGAADQLAPRPDALPLDRAAGAEVGVAGAGAAADRGTGQGRVARFVQKKLALARALYDGGQADVATICKTLGVSRATLYRAHNPRPDD